MGAPRAVRIARAPAGSAPLAFVPNTAGQARASNLFLGYLVLLLVIFLVFIGLAYTSPSPGPRSDTSAWAVLALLGIGLAIGGWTITLGRAPRGAVVRGEEIAVRERLGRVRRFPVGDAAHLRVVHHYPAGFLSPEATEMVELVAADRSRRTYLVGSGYFDELGASGERRPA